MGSDYHRDFCIFQDGTHEHNGQIAYKFDWAFVCMAVLMTVALLALKWALINISICALGNQLHLHH